VTTLPNTRCDVCNRGDLLFGIEIEGISYRQCTECHSILADPTALIDCEVQTYDDNYWSSEIISSRERAWATSLMRVAEVFALAGIPIERFLDISSGAGLLLEATGRLLPELRHCFYGSEPFPPPPAWRTTHENYRVGQIVDLDLRFDGGVCIEVIEHLFPETLRGLLKQLAKRSNPGALYYFNSAQPIFVKNHQYEYLDPLRRGHIASYSVEGMKALFSETGFMVYEIPGREWGFFAEYDPGLAGLAETPLDRLWRPLPANMALLKGCQFGEFFYYVGRDAIRCEIEMAHAQNTARWALTLDQEIKQGTERFEQELKKKNDQLNAIMSSSSWRATAPLREIVDGAKSLILRRRSF